MAKKSSIEKNKRRRKMVAQFAARRDALKAIANDESCRWRSASRRG